MRYDFQGTVTILKQYFYNGESNCGSYKVYISKIQGMSVELQRATHWGVGSRVTIIGKTAKLSTNEEYCLAANLKIHPKYGNELQIEAITIPIEDQPLDYYSKRKILRKIFTESQVQSMYDTYSDPYAIFLEGDAKKLTRIKGCGFKRAVSWMEKFNNFIPVSQVFLGLSEFELSTNTIKKLLDKYKSSDLVIQVIKENPYMLCELEGIGWARADKAALASGMSPTALPRIESFITLILESWMQQKGHVYRTVFEVINEIHNTLGDVPDLTINEAFRDLQDSHKVHLDTNIGIIGLERFWRLENNIADEVLRLLNTAPLYFNPDPDKIQDLIHKDEAIQGWTYTNEQIQGLKTVLENNFVIITGSAGTGKSSLMRLILQVFNDCNYQIAQTALSGRAAARLGEITQQEGSTIHRLLGFPKGDDSHQKFLFHEDCQLTEDIVIVDEISMIGGYVFYYLLRAIHSGTKVILLGDTGQLEPVGECNVAYDLLRSGLVPTVTLTKIQRQAMQSAIVMKSNDVRQGIQIIGENTAGIFVGGQDNDLVIDCYSDKSNTFQHTINEFTKCLKSNPDILNIQVISPMNTSGDSCNNQLNLALQELYNPSGRGTEIVFSTEKEGVYGIREGDKVINVCNNYSVPLAYDSNITVPVFNGNIGIVLETDPAHGVAIIDFNDVGVVCMGGDSLENVKLAYAISVHKFQGSECDTVIVAFDNDCYKMLSRELVYTAMTRAKKRCILVVQNKALHYAIAHPHLTEKRTYLAEILKSRVAPKKEEVFNF